jgi:hypothetical protein
MNSEKTINDLKIADQQKEMISKEIYDQLYKQALELEKRYTRLFEAYNNLLELYLTKN